MKVLFNIASQQCQDLMKEPIVLAIMGLIIIILLINSTANAKLIPEIDLHVHDGNDHFFSVGISNPFFEMSILLSVLSMFIGTMAIAEEKAGGSLKVLMTKPLYRRDVIVGKFLGMSMVIFFLTIIIVLLCISTQIICYRAPLSSDDLFLRMTSYTVVLFLSCELTLGISIFISIACKNMLSILIFTGTFLCVDWYLIPPESFRDITNFLVPTQLYLTILAGGGQYNLFETRNSFGLWLDSSALYILLLIIEIIAVIMVSSFIFTREEV